MVDEEPPAYRPRRALPAEPANDEPTVVLPDDEDAPKPLYRDEVPGAAAGPTATPGSGSSAGSARSARSASSATDETQILSRARLRAQAAAGKTPPSRTPSRTAARSEPPRGRSTRSQPSRGRAAADADATTMLPRTASGGRIGRRPDVVDDDPRDDESGGRGRLGLLIGVVAAIVVIGLAAGYLIINLTKPTAAPGTTTPPPGPTAGPSSATSSSSPPKPTPTAILTDASMVSAAAAQQIDDKRTWKVALTQRGLTADSPQPACLGGDAPDGQPDAQQTILRLISSNGSDAPALLHEALAYTSPEEAAQAYALMAKTIGGCPMAGGYIVAGKSVSGLGDQATGVVVNVTVNGKTTFRSLVMARTGRVIDILDVARPKDDVSFNRAVDVAGTAVKTQCAAAGGACVSDPGSKTAPPPVGGDEPGFLAIGDLPPVGNGQRAWVGVEPDLPDAGNKYSNCETVDFAKVEAEARAKRTYLLDNDTSRFGLDEIVIAAKSDKAAGDLADKIKGDWEDCKSGLTATVPKPEAVDGVGAKSAEINGWTTTVTQKAGTTSTRYRVGVVSVDNKVIFTFLNARPDLDLTDKQFELVTVRAGQRATQVN